RRRIRALCWAAVVAAVLWPGVAAAQVTGGQMFVLPGPPPAAPPPPAEEPPPPVPVRPPDRWELGASLSGSIFTVSYDGYPDVHGNDASGGVSLTHYLTPVVDDGAPRSLQPFLQRVSTISASIGGGGFVTRNPDGGQDRTDSHFGASAGFDVYVTRF